MQKRRDDYRCMSTDELIEETKRGHNLNWEELAVVLAEQLKTAIGGW